MSHVHPSLRHAQTITDQRLKHSFITETRWGFVSHVHPSLRYAQVFPSQRLTRPPTTEPWWGSVSQVRPPLRHAQAFTDQRLIRSHPPWGKLRLLLTSISYVHPQLRQAQDFTGQRLLRSPTTEAGSGFYWPASHTFTHNWGRLRLLLASVSYVHPSLRQAQALSPYLQTTGWWRLYFSKTSQWAANQ